MKTDATDDEGAMRDRGKLLLRQLSTEMARMQKEAFGKGPRRTNSYMFDDLLMIVMRDSLTVAEKTMVEFGQEDLVRNFRQQFENDMTSRIIGSIENVTGRKILTYQSQIMFKPDVVVEMFVFDRAGGYEGRFATAEGQIDDEAVGGVDDGSL